MHIRGFQFLAFTLCTLSVPSLEATGHSEKFPFEEKSDSRSLTRQMEQSHGGDRKAKQEEKHTPFQSSASKLKSGPLKDSLSPEAKGRSPVKKEPQFKKEEESEDDLGGMPDAIHIHCMGCNSMHLTIDSEDLDKAHKLLDQKKYKEARVYFEKVLKLSELKRNSTHKPLYYKVRVMLGLTSFLMKDYELAHSHYEEYYRNRKLLSDYRGIPINCKGFNDACYREYAGLAAFYTQRFQKAREHWKLYVSYIGAKKVSFDLLWKIAEVSILVNEVDDACEYYSRAFMKEGDSKLFYYCLAVKSLSNRGKKAYELALNLLRMAEQSPKRSPSEKHAAHMLRERLVEFKKDNPDKEFPIWQYLGTK